MIDPINILYKLREKRLRQYLQGIRIASILFGCLCLMMGIAGLFLKGGLEELSLINIGIGLILLIWPMVKKKPHQNYIEYQIINRQFQTERMNKDEAKKAIRHGSIAVCISAALTMLVMFLAAFFEMFDESIYWNDPILILDLLISFACAYGIYRKSRIAAVFIFTWFLLLQIVNNIDAEEISTINIGIALIFLYYFGRAIQGSFVFYRLNKKTT